MWWYQNELSTLEGVFVVRPYYELGGCRALHGRETCFGKCMDGLRVKDMSRKMKTHSKVHRQDWTYLGSQ